MLKSAADALIWIPERNAYENGKALSALFRVVSNRFRCYHLERHSIKRGAALCQTQNPYRRGLQRSTAPHCITRSQVQATHSFSSMDTFWIEDPGTISSPSSLNATGSSVMISEALAIQG